MGSRLNNLWVSSHLCLRKKVIKSLLKDTMAISETNGLKMISPSVFISDAT